MVRKTLTIFACLSLAFAAVAAQAANANPAITVITSGQRPINVSGIDPAVIKVFNLDAVRDIEAQLSRNLPVNEAEALAIARKRIDNIGQSTLNAKLTKAYSGVLTALTLGIDRYPAIVFENRFIVYGITDVAVALQKYYAWQEKGDQLK